ncbi:MAG: hypothetical protein AAGC93_21470 [Cyanobacteria bacterium P01_F01_bin.53]
MPFLPLFIVIGLFLATSKILQPSQQLLSKRDNNDDDRALNQALIDYIAREAQNQAGKANRRNTTAHVSKSKKKGYSLPSLEQFLRTTFPSEWLDYEHIFADLHDFKGWLKAHRKPIWKISFYYNWAYILTCVRFLVDVFLSSAKRILSRK